MQNLVQKITWTFIFTYNLAKSLKSSVAFLKSSSSSSSKYKEAEAEMKWSRVVNLN